MAQWLLAQNVAVLVTADDIREKGPGYASGDAAVEIVISDAPCLAVATDLSTAQSHI